MSSFFTVIFPWPVRHHRPAPQKGIKQGAIAFDILIAIAPSFFHLHLFGLLGPRQIRYFVSAFPQRISQNLNRSARA